MTNATPKKKTKREVYNELLKIPAIADNVEYVEFINHQIKLLDRKNASGSGAKKETALQKANNELKVKIVERMSKEPDRYFTCSEIAKVVPELNGANPQKVAPLMNALEKEGILEKTRDKKTYFRIKHDTPTEE